MEVVLQTGRLTSPTLLIEDLKAIPEIRIDRRGLGVVFYGGGGIELILILTAITNIAVLADIIYKHVKELKKDKDGSDLRILIRGKIRTNKKEIGLNDFEYEKIISLKGKSLNEINRLLQEAQKEDTEEKI